MNNTDKTNKIEGLLLLINCMHQEVFHSIERSRTIKEEDKHKLVVYNNIGGIPMIMYATKGNSIDIKGDYVAIASQTYLAQLISKFYDNKTIMSIVKRYKKYIESLSHELRLPFNLDRTEEVSKEFDSIICKVA